MSDGLGSLLLVVRHKYLDQGSLGLDLGPTTGVSKTESVQIPALLYVEEVGFLLGRSLESCWEKPCQEFHMEGL